MRRDAGEQHFARWLRKDEVERSPSDLKGHDQREAGHERQECGADRAQHRKDHQSSAESQPADGAIRQEQLGNQTSQADVEIELGVERGARVSIHELLSNHVAFEVVEKRGPESVGSEVETDAA